jgi:hypothetical protein
MAKVKYSVSDELVGSDVWVEDKVIVLSKATQKELEYLYKRGYPVQMEDAPAPDAVK